MKKNVFGRKLKRDANERKALFKNLLTSLVMHERIQTTRAKAKAVRSAADKLITTAKKGEGRAYQNLAPQVNHNAVIKLINEIAPRFATRQGGYTRIIKTGRRVSDNAPMAILEWTERKRLEPGTKDTEKDKKKKLKPQKETKKAKEVKAPKKTVKAKKGEKK